MRTALLALAALLALLPALAARPALAEAPPAPPSGIVLEMNPSFRGPSPHMFNLLWVVAQDANGYGWEVERGFPNSAGAVAFVPWRTIAPNLAFPGDFANVIDDETPPGKTVCYRIRAVAPALPSSDWSVNACGDLAHVPPPVPMEVSATVLPNGVSVSWKAQPTADLGYWPQEATVHADGLRDWLGIGIIPQGAGRLSVFAPVSILPARWCFRVFPISSSSVSIATSEETCVDYPGDTDDPRPSPPVPATPAPPPTGSGGVAGRGNPVGAKIGSLLALAGLALLLGPKTVRAVRG